MAKLKAQVQDEGATFRHDHQAAELHSGGHGNNHVLGSLVEVYASGSEHQLPNH